MSRTLHSSAEMANQIDFCRAFEAEMKPLYLLAFLLTSNHAAAERCFLDTLDQVNSGSPKVFKSWVMPWIKHNLIKSALQSVLNNSQSRGGCDRWSGNDDEWSSTIDSVAELPCRERITFVLSVLERCSVRKCALLLGCSMEAVEDARFHALLLLRRSSQIEASLQHMSEVATSAREMDLT